MSDEDIDTLVNKLRDQNYVLTVDESRHLREFCADFIAQMAKARLMLQFLT